MHPQRSILTRALGVDEEVDPDAHRIEVRSGDRLLLCSDGLTSMVEEERIHAILREEEDPQAAADALVEAANLAGGQDNITAVVIDVLDDGPVPGAVVRASPEDTAPTAPVPGGPAQDQEEPHQPRDLTGQGFSAGPRGSARFRGRRWGRRLVVWLLLPLLLVGGGLWAAKTYWVDRQFYVGQADGHVAVFRGIPAAPFGLDLSDPVEEYPELDAATVTEFPEFAGLPEGITADDEDDARAIVAEMQRTVAEAEREQGPG